jgi:hypothetical protein
MGPKTGAGGGGVHGLHIKTSKSAHVPITAKVLKGRFSSKLEHNCEAISQEPDGLATSLGRQRKSH